MADTTQQQNLSAAFPGQQANTSVVNPAFDPNGTTLFNANTALLAAMQNYNALNSAVNQMIGIDSVWFRAVPQQRSKDVIFQEYTLSCVADPVCPKVMVSGGNWPDSKYNYDLMGLEYEMPTEVQIDKIYWESIAGYGTAPQKKDIVYLPMPNKLYQVESCYLKRGFMEQETTWVCNLKKYQPEASRREGAALKETIDKYTVSEAEIFGEAIAADVEKLVDDKQTSPFNSTVRDFYKTINKDLKIVPYNLDVNGVIAAQTFYDFTAMPKTDPTGASSFVNFSAIIYKNSGETILKNQDRSIVSWIMPRSTDLKEYNVVSITPDLTFPGANYSIAIQGSRNFVQGDTFTISRPGALNFYAKVIAQNTTQGLYFCKIDSGVESYLDSINPTWRGIKNYKTKIQDPINLIDGRNNTTHGLQADIYANQYIKVIYGSNEYIISMNQRLENNNWYGVVVNVGNTWGQLNAHVWQPAASSFGDEKLTTFFTKTIPFVTEETVVDNYTVNRSSAYITNIRLFRTTIEDEKQTLELLSYLSKDADQAIILDNADEKFMSPYISRQR